MLINVIICLLIIVIFLQFKILKEIRASRAVQVETNTVVAKGLDWIDAGLENSLDEYRGYGS